MHTGIIPNTCIHFVGYLKILIYTYFAVYILHIYPIREYSSHWGIFFIYYTFAGPEIRWREPRGFRRKFSYNNRRRGQARSSTINWKVFAKFTKVFSARDWKKNTRSRKPTHAHRGGLRFTWWYKPTHVTLTHTFTLTLSEGNTKQ